MRYRWFLSIPCLILFILYPFEVSHARMAEVKVEEEGPVDIEADQLIYERETQLYQAHGRVKILRGNLSLSADHAQLNMATRDLVSWGNVLLTEGEDVLECERLEVNLNTKAGTIYHAKLFLKDQNFHVTGRELDKLGENRYRIRDGSFTTCDSERPPWKFTVKELNVELGGYGIAKGPIFYVENIPMLYLPFGVFPVVLERQTGFLFPRIGYSDKYGPELKNAFFWAITKNMDATFYFDWVEERGFKEGLEYRYAFTQETKGEAKVYFTDDHVYDGNRYAFFLQHQQRLPYDSYLKWDINHVSDHQYVRDYDEDLPGEAKIDSRSLNLLRSVLFGGKNWDRFSFLADTEVYQNLTIDSNDITLQKLPKMSLYAFPQSVFDTPIFFEFGSSYTNFWRERGAEAQRGDVFPIVSYPMRLFDILKLDPSLGFRETLYYSYNDPTGTLKRWDSRETLEAGLQASVEFYRVYDAGVSSKISNLYNVTKWMHTIEPIVTYRYSPRVNQINLPAFDEVDQIPYTNEITYGITQSLVGRPEKVGVSAGAYEYARLMIYQSYSLGDPYLDREGKKRSFSPIQAQLWWNFGPYLSAQWDAAFSPYHGNFETFNFLITAKDRRNDGVQVQYRYTDNRIEEINLAARVKTIASLHLFGSMRYNLVDNWKVENIYGFEYKAQCWSLGLAVEDLGKSPDGTQQKELRVQVYLQLLNLGSLGGKKPYPLTF